MKIASWNVNSIRARLTPLTRWMDVQKPDVLLLQETKVTDDEFPSEDLLRRGYSVVYAGQKSSNGVAILSQSPIRDIVVGFPDDGPEADRRLITATIEGIRISSAYIPNGRDIAHPMFQIKLAWLTRLRGFLEQQRQTLGLPGVVGGDFNVAREARDVWAPELFEGQVHFHPEERARMQALLDAGFIDSFRQFCDEPARYSWWDYRGPSLSRNRGLRIDYLFVDESLRARCKAAGIDPEPRQWDKPSDHVPVWVELT
jgi:exodeoxyribonuclease-3